MLKELIPYKGVGVLTSASVKSFKDGIVTVAKDNEECKLEADSVVLAVGYRENDALYNSLMFDVPEIYNLGDSKKVQNIMYAIWDAFEVANHI
jgi:2-enoate reductase